MKIILASASPRRKQLLEKHGVEFKVIPSSFNEPKNLDLSPEKYAEYLAFKKAEDVFLKEGGIVIGADTIVVYDNLILGKPKDYDDAIKMLTLLSGKTHKVITGYSIISKDKVVKGCDVTLVTFNNLPNEQITTYVKTKNPLDKAGAYGIQDGDLVKDISGDYENVVGLPTKIIVEKLKEFL
jgi:septum formation protein